MGSLPKPKLTTTTTTTTPPWALTPKRVPSLITGYTIYTLTIASTYTGTLPRLTTTTTPTTTTPPWVATPTWVRPLTTGYLKIRHTSKFLDLLSLPKELSKRKPLLDFPFQDLLHSQIASPVTRFDFSTAAATHPSPGSEHQANGVRFEYCLIPPPPLEQCHPKAKTTNPGDVIDEDPHGTQAGAYDGIGSVCSYTGSYLNVLMTVEPHPPGYAGLPSRYFLSDAKTVHSPQPVAILSRSCVSSATDRPPCLTDGPTSPSAANSTTAFGRPLGKRWRFFWDPTQTPADAT